jgi:hypothetical protein
MGLVWEAWADVGTQLEARRRYDSFDELIKGGMSGAEASTEFAPSQCWVPFSCS